MKPRTELIDPNKIVLPIGYNPPTEILDATVQSVKEQGLFHSPLIKDNYEIIAGKLRVKAARLAGLTEIECHVYPSDLSADDYQVLGLHENLKRYNLPWDQQVIQEKQLHDIRQAQHGTGTRGHKTGWSLRDTAAELNKSVGLLSEDIRLADAILADPSFARIGDKQTAKRVIFGKLKQLAQEQGISRPVDFQVNQCVHGSSEVILRMFSDQSFDACITDPPWLEFKDDKLIKDSFTSGVFKEVYRVLKANAFLYMFVSTQDWIIYYEELRNIGFNVQKWPLIWVKEGVVTRGSTSWQYQRDYEPIMLAVKGSPSLTTNGLLSSVYHCKVVPAVSLTHPNEKPPEIIKRLVDNCTYEGSIVLDPFAGSFVVPDVCKQMRRRYIAIERDAKYFIQGEKRLKGDI